ncbi:OsmC family protein [Helicobacter marmotae]|uniref:OsmC family peroxiredoxin n=1 Tax=Helicobacter marmotae TaxID=152490 RepID=A0A3D8I5C5_9HELI|nr:OsmC family protein [Helicobacter marmotae]RDU60339.1 OsmC family peroxiredoxin [Helicobacter marmotae]
MKVAQTSCTRLEPISKSGLDELIKQGKANPNAIKTLKCKTIAEGKFRHANYIRNLPAYIVDEPPTLLGEDSAPNPSEALLAALGSCLAVGIHANAVANDIVIYKLELKLEADINITSVWGSGDLSQDKPLGFSAIRVKVDLESNASKEREKELIAHAKKYSPVANTLEKAVSVSINESINR